MQPTIEELYALPPCLLKRNFALKDIQMLHGARMSDASFNVLRCSLNKFEIEDVPDVFNLFAGRVKLTFLDINGDQDYLDAHQKIKATMTDLVVTQYDDCGKPERELYFYDVQFSGAKQSLDANGFTPTGAADRVNEYTFQKRREVKIA